MGEITIVRKYDIVRNKNTRFEQIITIGLDSNSNVFGFCKKCNMNMERNIEFDKIHKLKITTLKCKSCGVSLQA